MFSFKSSNSPVVFSTNFENSFFWVSHGSEADVHFVKCRAMACFKSKITNLINDPFHCRIRKARAGGVMTFPVFWKPKDDRVNLQNDTDEAVNNYSRF